MNRELIVKMKFGSHLYGLETPFSDLDYKGIYFPTPTEILTCQVPKSETYSSGPKHEKNSSSDVDFEAYSLHYFLSLAAQGETVALDMLHASSRALLHTSQVWKNLRMNRERFYTKRMKSFVGYARKQAAKYGIKGSRLEAARSALAFLTTHGSKTIEEVYDELWENEHCKKYESPLFPKQFGSPVEVCWEVCGKKMMAKSKCEHYIPMMKKFYEAYGIRARLAEQNEGVDWKAVSHALRAAYQVRHILKRGGYQYPLPETQHILQVKQGQLPFKIVGPQLEELVNQIEELAEKSSLPEQPDLEWIQDFLEQNMLDYLIREEELISIENLEGARVY